MKSVTYETEQWRVLLNSKELDETAYKLTLQVHETIVMKAHDFQVCAEWKIL